MLDKIILFFNSVVALLLLLCLGLPFLPPQSFSFLAVFSLMTPILIGLNIVFFMYWLLRLKRQFIVSLLIIALSLPHLKSTIRFNNCDNIQAEGIKVMSYNVRLLNIYNWIDSKNIPQNIQQFFQSQTPDLLCVQEYHSSRSEPLSFPYVYRSDTESKSELVIFSNFPFINKGSITFPKSANSAIFTDVVVNSDTLRLYNVHLQSSRLNTDFNNLDTEQSDRLIHQLRQTFATQQEQAELLSNHILKSPYPVLLCGDFNNTSHSYVYRMLKSNLQDAFEISGCGFGRTYAMDYYPARIDFILVDPQIVITQFTTHTVEYSDHFPISARLKL